MKHSLILLFLAALIVTLPIAGNDLPVISGIYTAPVDGDTWYMTGDKERIRAWGYDAPECSPKPCLHDPATQLVNSLIDGQLLTCKQMQKQRSFDRLVLRCFLSDGRDIGQIMVDSGLVTESCKYSKGAYGHCD